MGGLAVAVPTGTSKDHWMCVNSARMCGAQSMTPAQQMPHSACMHGTDSLILRHIVYRKPLPCAVSLYAVNQELAQAAMG
jgi:hypothetical protein